MTSSDHHCQPTGPGVLEGEITPRTVAAHDISAFAGMVGDYSRIHLDDTFGVGLVHGGRIAHGLLSASWALGGLSLAAPPTMGRRDPSAYLSSCEANYRRPVLAGTTLSCHWRTISRGSDEAGGGGARTSFEMRDAEGRTVTDGHVVLRRGQGVSDFRAPDPWPAAELVPDPAKTYYLEDFTPGAQAGQTEGRTLTEADVVAYGGFTGDSGGHHGDAEFARGGLFGTRVVQPMLVFNIGFALWLRDWCRMRMPDGGLAGHLCDRWVFHRPFHIGDTLGCRHRTLAVRKSKSCPDTGVVTCGLQLLNQRDEVTMSAEVLMMFPAGGA